MNVSKHDTMWDKDGEIPRDQRKYVAQGIDEEGDPIKEKYKRKELEEKILLKEVYMLRISGREKGLEPPQRVIRSSIMNRNM